MLHNITKRQITLYLNSQGSKYTFQEKTQFPGYNLGFEFIRKGLVFKKKK